MPLRTTSRIPFVLVLALTACASGGSHEDAPARVDAVLGRIEDVNDEAERARQVITESYERLTTLAAGRFDRQPAAAAFATFVQSIDVAEQQALRFREAVQSMVAAAQPVFAQRQADLKGITSQRLRQRSELRYSEAKERYDAITASAVPAQDRFDAYVKALRDHAAFLAHDLNASALADIQDEVKLVAHTARELDRALDSCQVAARTYVQQAALPAAPGR
jgi:hypothetical protein